MNKIINFPIKKRKPCGDPWCNTIQITEGQLLEMRQDLQHYHELKEKINKMSLFDRIFNWEFGIK